MRTCRKCGQRKPTSEYYVSRGRVDRRCKACRVATVRAAQKRLDPPKPWKICPTCAGLSHRVIGPKCTTCGLRYAPQPPLELHAWVTREDPRADYV